MSSGRSILELSHISVRFRTQSGKSVLALDDVSATIGQNEFVTILGPSGCGKSTLLKIASQVLEASAGEVRFEGHPLRTPTARIGLVFQQPILMPWRTVLQNVLFPIEMMGRRISDHEREARALIELVGLEGFENVLPGELSGGMQQRVAICRALVYDPKVLLMDEPFAALDAITREELGMELLRIWSERRKTVVFVTHSIQESVLLSDRVLVMTARPGRVASSIKIELPRPRHVGMVSTPEYAAHAEEIRALIGLTHGSA